LGGYRLRIVGWDRRYDQYPSGEARLMYKDGKFFLMIFKRVPRTSKYAPKGFLAVDVNEKEVVFRQYAVEGEEGDRHRESAFITKSSLKSCSRSIPLASTTPG
jgi:hypothetical protein